MSNPKGWKILTKHDGSSEEMIVRFGHDDVAAEVEKYRVDHPLADDYEIYEVEKDLVYVTEDNSPSKFTYTTMKVRKQLKGEDEASVRNQKNWFLKNIGDQSKSEAVQCEVVAQEFLRLIVPGQPKTRYVTNQEGDEVYVLSEMRPGFKSMLEVCPKEDKLFPRQAAILTVCDFLRDSDPKAGNFGIDSDGNAVKFDGGGAYLGSQWDYNKYDVKRLQQLPSPTFDRMCMLWYGKGKQFNDENTKREVLETLLKLILTPDEVLMQLMKHHMSLSIARKYSLSMMDRKLNLQAAALQMPEFRAFLNSENAEKVAKEYTEQVKQYRMTGSEKSGARFSIDDASIGGGLEDLRKRINTPVSKAEVKAAPVATEKKISTPADEQLTKLAMAIEEFNTLHRPFHYGDETNRITAPKITTILEELAKTAPASNKMRTDFVNKLGPKISQIIDSDNEYLTEALKYKEYTEHKQAMCNIYHNSFKKLISALTPEELIKLLPNMKAYEWDSPALMSVIYKLKDNKDDQLKAVQTILPHLSESACKVIIDSGKEGASELLAKFCEYYEKERSATTFAYLRKDATYHVNKYQDLYNNCAPEYPKHRPPEPDPIVFLRNISKEAVEKHKDKKESKCYNALSRLLSDLPKEMDAEPKRSVSNPRGK